MSSKAYLIVGIFASAGMVAVIVYLNKQPEVAAPKQQVTLPKQTEESNSPEPDEWHPKPFPQQKKPPSAGQRPDEKGVELERFFNNPAITHRLERIVSLENELLEREKEYLSPEEWNEHYEKFHRTLTREALYEKYQKLISEKLTGEELRNLNDAYPVIDALHDAKHRFEQHEKTPAEDEEYVAYLQQFDPATLPVDRLNVLEELGSNLQKFDSGYQDFPMVFGDEKGKLYADQLAYLNKMLEGKSTHEIEMINSNLANPAVLKEAQVWSAFAGSLWDEGS